MLRAAPEPPTVLRPGTGSPRTNLLDLVARETADRHEEADGG
ncbi:hypothetical protein OG426_40995 [Streptomyces canus]|nr:hypothetical protein [Streptomyces canus]MCX4856139.1 hypothetical protein [Streptomyces canus]WSW38381.1 hypothetical protein OG426_40995 [Streptomyces canus]